MEDFLLGSSCNRFTIEEFGPPLQFEQVSKGNDCKEKISKEHNDKGGSAFYIRTINSLSSELKKYQNLVSELQSQNNQLQVLNTQLQGTLKKKDSEFQKLQLHLLKLLKDTTRGKTGASFIAPTPSAKSTKSATEFHKSPSATYLLQKENIGLKNIITHYEQQEKHFMDKIVTLQDEVKDLSLSASRLAMTITPHHTKEQLYIASTGTRRTAQTVVHEHHHQRLAGQSAATPATTDLLHAIATPDQFFQLRDAPMSSGALNLSFSEQSTACPAVPLPVLSPLSPIGQAAPAPSHWQLDDLETEMVAKMQRVAPHTTDLNLSLQYDLEDAADDANSSSGHGQEDLEALWQRMKMLPPSSPATVQLLRSCGWSVLPPLKSEAFSSPKPRSHGAAAALSFDAPVDSLRKHFRDCFEAVEAVAYEPDEGDGDGDPNHLLTHFS